MPSESESSPRIEWASAEVEDGELQVELAGELPKGWAKRFGAVFARLGADGEQRWGEARVKKGRLLVGGLTEGCEADLRHELESALQQANADLLAGEDDREQSPEDGPDARMTAAFRSFADGT